MYCLLAAVLALGNCYSWAFTTSSIAFRAVRVNPGATITSPAASRRHGVRMVSDEESERALTNMARAARKVGPNDRVVELRKPMGLVLEEDERGNVYVVEIYPGSNAARTKNISVGDKIAFVSATFGDEVWSAKGVGLSRVRSAIKLRQGPLVKLVLETTKEGEKKRQRDADKLRKQQEEKESTEDKRNRLLSELQDDTKKQKKKGWYGLF